MEMSAAASIKRLRCFVDALRRKRSAYVKGTARAAQTQFIDGFERKANEIEDAATKAETVRPHRGSSANPGYAVQK